MKIQTSCRYDYEMAKALVRCRGFARWSAKTELVITAVLSAIALLILLESALLLGFIPVSITLLLIAPLPLLLSCYVYFLLPRLAWARQRTGSPIENVCTFCPEHIRLEAKADGVDSAAEVAYASVLRLVETRNYYFFFQSRALAWPVDKRTIRPEDEQPLRAYLRAQFPGKRYVFRGGV